MSEPPSPTTSDSSSRAPILIDNQSLDSAAVLPNIETVHYLSPATTNRTLCEGDFDYSPYLPFLEFGPPSFASASTISCEEAGLQRTIAIIKPEAMIYKDVVLKVIADNGFSIISQRTVHLTPEQVAEIYAQYYGCPSFPNMVVSTSLGPLLVLSLAAVNAVEKWKKIVGPYSAIQAEWFLPLNVRNRFGLHVDIPDVLHASEHLRNSNKENRFFFPKNILEPIISDQDKVEDYCNLHLRPILLKALVELVRKKPADPIIFLAEYLLVNNPLQPIVPYNYAMAAT